MKNILITGANRGLGLALTKQYISIGDNVIATCRKNSQELEQTGATIISNIDIAETKTLDKLATQINNEGIDILINNAGAWCNDSLDNMNFDSIIQNFKTNTIGTMRIINLLKNKLNNPAKIIIITSKMGSMSDNTSGGRYGYRMSKAALNAAGKSLAIDLKQKNISVALIHPGWVKTDMGGSNALISANDSAFEITNTINNVSLDNSGSFFNYNGKIIPW